MKRWLMVALGIGGLVAGCSMSSSSDGGALGPPDDDPSSTDTGADPSSASTGADPSSSLDGGASSADTGAGTSSSSDGGASSADTGGGPSSADTGGGAGACGCVDEKIRWDLIGGWNPVEPHNTLSPCGTFSHAVVPVGRNLTPQAECSQELESCGQGVSAGDVAEALAHPDVAAAIAAAPVLYGVDGRNLDGALRRLTIGKAVIDVGYDCASRPNCVPTPEGVAALVDLLEQLEDEQLARAPCNTVFPKSTSSME